MNNACQFHFHNFFYLPKYRYFHKDIWMSVQQKYMALTQTHTTTYIPIWVHIYVSVCLCVYFVCENEKLIIIWGCLNKRRKVGSNSARRWRWWLYILSFMKGTTEVFIEQVITNSSSCYKAMKMLHKWLHSNEYWCCYHDMVFSLSSLKDKTVNRIL